MANRSDFNSTLQRADKKLLALTKYKDAHEEGEIRRLFVVAHAHHKVVRIKRLAARSEVQNSGDSAD